MPTVKICITQLPFQEFHWKHRYIIWCVPTFKRKHETKKGSCKNHDTLPHLALRHLATSFHILPLKHFLQVASSNMFKHVQTEGRKEAKALIKKLRAQRILEASNGCLVDIVWICFMTK
jgi:hypothetical protein